MRIFILILPLLIALPTLLFAQEWESDGPNSRILRHDDGSRTIYKRAPGQKILIKKNINPQGNVRLITRYHMDDHGNPRSCKIYDPTGKELFKVSYAYQISTGRLMKERMFFSDKAAANGQPIIASETRYTYDAQGNRSKPEVFTFVKGRTAEELFGKKSTLPDKVFDEHNDIANPAIHKIEN